MFCIVPSCPLGFCIVSCFVLSYHVPSCFVLSYHVLYCPIHKNVIFPQCVPVYCALEKWLLLFPLFPPWESDDVGNSPIHKWGLSNWAPTGWALQWRKCWILIPWPTWALWIAGWDWRPLDQSEANSTESRLVKPIFTPVFESDDFCPGISETLHLAVVIFFLLP